jgi:hypothetical protein
MQDIEFSNAPTNLQDILERYIEITVEYADNVEQLHIHGDNVLLDTLKYIVLYFPETGSNDYPSKPTLRKIIKMFENNPAWYS